MSTHEDRVARIAAQIRDRARDSGYASLHKAAVSHFVPNPADPKHHDRKIDVRALREILEIDVPGRRCVAEPGVTFSDLVRATLRVGLVPKLVPELKTITIGGAVAGCSVESMSFRYGGFHDSCRSYEVITGTGDVLTCSRAERPLLFGMIHGSYGTLGILTKLEFDLVPAKPFVRMEYQTFDAYDTFRDAMMSRCAVGDVDFIDAIVHGPRKFVLCLGRFVDRAPYVSDYSYLRIYYKSTASRGDDYLTTYDYFFRYDTECHWLSRTIPGMETLPMRLLLGKQVLGSSNLLRWSKRLGHAAERIFPPNVVVDVFIPGEHLDAFYGWYARRFDYYPLWLVPYRVPEPYPWIADGHARKAKGDFYVDCAVYGKRNDEPGVNYYQLLEDKTCELGGIKTLISKNFYDESTFWSIYHREHYDSVKRETDPRNMFRGLYEKFHFGAAVANDATRPAPSGHPSESPQPRAP